MAIKRVGIIGATGSIGKQAIDVIIANPELFEVVFLSAHNNKEELYELVSLTQACYGVLTSDEQNKNMLTNILDGEAPDIVLHAASGIGGIKSVYDVVSRGIDIALANKESMVTAGPIILDAAEKSGSKIIPVDSEHSAIFQCLMGQRKKSLKSVTLTASGGPFRDTPIEMMGSITPADALNHPNWRMGRKISIDSATMMNKGLELIEARYLFDIKADKLEVLVHPESIVHSFVSFLDGSTIAQLGRADMRVPISFALGFPDRIVSNVETLDLSKIRSLRFEAPDLIKFPCLKIAIDVLNADSNAHMTAMNAANEAAVNAFLNCWLRFDQIAVVVREVLDKCDFSNALSIDDALSNSDKAYKLAVSIIDSFNTKG